MNAVHEEGITMSFRLVAVFALIAVSFASFPGYAENSPSMTKDQLIAERDKLYSELAQINMMLGETNKLNGEQGPYEIKNLFPDEALAKLVRDATRKFSINQNVTQEELDQVKYISIFHGDYGDFNDLTGIGLLHNLETFDLYNGTKYLGTVFPDEFYELKKLKSISVCGSSIISLSDKVGNLENLEELDVSYTGISLLPDSIGNLSNLKDLDIAFTKITELPDSIYTLSLDKLDMGGLPIE